MIVYLSLAVAVIGWLLWRFNSKPIWSETGKIMFTVGLLAFLLLVVGGKPIGFLGNVGR